MDKFPKVEMQTKLQADMMSYTIGSTALAVWVTALMIVAGILLLKGRKSARKWSNCYAISSISVKIINMVVLGSLRASDDAENDFRNGSGGLRAPGLGRWKA